MPLGPTPRVPASVFAVRLCCRRHGCSRQGEMERRRSCSLRGMLLRGVIPRSDFPRRLRRLLGFDDAWVDGFLPHTMQNTRVPFQAGGWQRRNRNSLLSHGGSFVLPELHSRSEKRPVLEQSIANRFLQPGRRAARPICGASEGTGWRRSRGHVICSQRWIDWVGS